MILKFAVNFWLWSERENVPMLWPKRREEVTSNTGKPLGWRARKLLKLSVGDQVSSTDIEKYIEAGWSVPREIAADVYCGEVNVLLDDQEVPCQVVSAWVSRPLGEKPTREETEKARTEVNNIIRNALNAYLKDGVFKLNYPSKVNGVRFRTMALWAQEDYEKYYGYDEDEYTEEEEEQ